MVQAPQSGKLRLTVVEAALTRDTEFFGKMDPFCIVEYRQERFKTNVKDNAGKKPVWNQTFDIDVKYIGDDMWIKVFDEDITDNDAVGACQMKCSSLCVQGGLDDWFTITYKGKSAGKVHLKSTWTPHGPAPTQAPAQQPQPGFQNQQQMGQMFAMGMQAPQPVAPMGFNSQMAQMQKWGQNQVQQPMMQPMGQPMMQQPMQPMQPQPQMMGQMNQWGQQQVPQQMMGQPPMQQMQMQPPMGQPQMMQPQPYGQAGAPVMMGQQPQMGQPQMMGQMNQWGQQQVQQNMQYQQPPMGQQPTTQQQYQQNFRPM